MAKKEKEVVNRFELLLASEALEKFKKLKSTAGLIETADTLAEIPTGRISTGILSLDAATGGGFPAGGFTMLYGHEHSGKSTIFLKAIANAQKQCAFCHTRPNAKGKCVCGEFRPTTAAIVDMEGAFDPIWARKLGIDTSRVLVHKPGSGEEAVDFMDTMVQSGCDLIMLDSLAYLTPTKELEACAEDAQKQMGLQARMIGSAIRRLVALCNAQQAQDTKRVTMFVTNQIRYKTGVIYGNPETMSGGQSPKFWMDVIIRLTGKLQGDKNTSEMTHQDITFKVTKLRGASTMMDGDIRISLIDSGLYKPGDSYDVNFILDKAELHGLLRKEGKTWQLGKVDDFVEFPRREAIIEGLNEDPNLRSVVSKDLMERILGHWKPAPEPT